MGSQDDARLAQGLADAQQRLAQADLEPAERATLQRRLLAITDAAKHDTARALERLDRWLADLEAR